MLIDVEKLKQNFNKNYHKVSFSKLKSFISCEQFFIINTFIEDTSIKKINHRYAISGVIVQRIFEELFNKKIYLVYKNTNDLNAWVKDNVYGLFYSIYFDVEEQYNLEINKRDYFSSHAGISRLNKYKKAYPYFNINTNINPMFISETELLFDRESILTYENFLNSLIDIIINNINQISLNLNINPSNITSEVYISYAIDNLILSGIVDFIDISYQTKDFIIFDGKFYKTKQDPLQLVFYSFILNQQYKTNPYKAGYLIWKDSTFREVKITEKDYVEFSKILSNYKNRIAIIHDMINSLNIDYISNNDLFSKLNKSPSFSACKYCPIFNLCDVAYGREN